MPDDIDKDRRRLLGNGAMTMAAARVGMLGTLSTAEPSAGESRESAALGRATEWLNSPRLTPANFAGKVVLVDFCTYTCINWLRTLPHIRAWAQNARQGLLVVGVPPSLRSNGTRQRPSRDAADADQVLPIVIDNDYSIWRAFNNRTGRIYLRLMRADSHDHRIRRG